MDDALSWAITGYRGLSWIVINYQGSRGLWIIMVYMIFVETCFPFMSYIWESFSYRISSMGSGTLLNPCGGASIK